MANEFTARNGLIAQKDSVVTGSLIVTSGITGSLLGTASYAAQALSSSYASAYAAVFPYTGSAIISGSLTVTGSVLVSGSVRVGLGTSANNAIQFGSADLGMSGTSAGRLDFNTSGTSRMAILSNGTVVMGSDTTNIIGNTYLDYTTNATGIRFTTTTLTLSTGTGTGGSGVNYLRMFQTGNVTLQNGGTFTDAGYRLDVQGTSRFSGNITTTGAIDAQYYLNIVNPNLVATASSRIQVTNGAAFSSVFSIGSNGDAVDPSILYLGGSNKGILFSSNSVGVLKVFDATRNIIIQNGGTFTDAGYRLDVQGTMRVSGSSTAYGKSMIVQSGLNSVDFGQWDANNTGIWMDAISTTRTGGNYTLLGGGGQTYLNAATGGAISLRINNVDLIRVNSTNATLGSTNQNLIFTPTAGNPTLVQNGATSSLMRTTSGTRNLQLESYSGDSNYLSANGAPFTIRTTDSWHILFRTNNLVAGNISNAQNWTLGGSVDAGYRLDVQGTSRFTGDVNITGSIYTNSTSSNIFDNSAGSNYLRVRRTGGTVEAVLGSTAGGVFVGSSTVHSTNIQTSGVTRISTFSTGNTVIQNGGTFTDAGYLLDVQGTTRFNGNSIITGSLTVSGSTTHQIIGNTYFTTPATAGGTVNIVSLNNTPTLTFSQAGTAGRLQIIVNGGSQEITSFKSFVSNGEFNWLNNTTNYLARLTTNGNLLLPGSGSTTIPTDAGYRLDVSGSTRIRGYVNTSISSSLVVYGSGSTQPVFTVQGSQGELFSVTDSLSGSLFSVNDISGLPILEAFSDNTVLLGSYQAPALLTTNKILLTASGNFTLSSLPTASYDGAFYDYTVRSGSNARAGTIMAIWSGSSVNFTETTTTSFGSTTGLNLGVFVSGGNMVLTGSAATTAWTIKTIIRSI